ncbi:MAG: alpha/beta hydrolase [Aeromicrobium sp.]
MSGEWSTTHEIDLAYGRIRYHERGDGPPIVFVHGLLVNAELWRKVIPTVADAGYRCIAPDLPLGSHSIPVPRADLSPSGVADLIADFLEALGLEDVTLVANDTGGALTQILMTRHPERIGRVVLTPADSFERFFPPAFAFLPPMSRIPGFIWILAQTLRLRFLHRLPFTFGWVAKRPIDRATVDNYLSPSRKDRGIRKDLARFLRGVNRRHTLAAAEKLPAFTKPVLLAWATEEKLFPLSLAHRLDAILPDSQIVEIADSYTFVPEDQPDELSGHILDFVSTHVA